MCGLQVGQPQAIRADQLRRTVISGGLRGEFLPIGCGASSAPPAPNHLPPPRQSNRSNALPPDFIRLHSYLSVSFPGAELPTHWTD